MQTVTSRVSVLARKHIRTLERYYELSAVISIKHQIILLKCTAMAVVVPMIVNRQRLNYNRKIRRNLRDVLDPFWLPEST